MKALIVLTALLLAAFVFTGCQDSNLGINTSNSEPDRVPVPLKGSLEGITSPQAWNCGGTTFGRYADGNGNLTHLGNSYAEFEYCVLYTSQTGGLIVPKEGRVNYIQAADGDRLYLVITDGTFQVAGTMEYNGVTYIKTLGYMNANITGGTGRFVNASGTTQIIAVNLLDLVNPLTTQGICFGEFNGTLTY